MAFDLNAVKQACANGKAARDQYNRMLERAKNAVIAEINGAEFEDHLQDCLTRAFVLDDVAKFMYRCDISCDENESKDKHVYRITIELSRFEGGVRYTPCKVSDVSEENILYPEKSFKQMFDDAHSIVHELDGYIRNRINALGLNLVQCPEACRDYVDINTAYTCFGVWVYI